MRNTFMFGIGNLSRALNNVAKAAELQTQKLVVESASDVAKTMAKANISSDDLNQLKELQATLDQI